MSNYYEDFVEYLGGQATFYPSMGEDGGINLVYGIEAVTKSIVDFFLTMEGECAVYPDYGIGVKVLQTPKSADSAYALAYQAQEKLWQWNQKTGMGIKNLRVDTISDNPQTPGQIDVSVSFTPVGVDADSPPVVLTLDYYLYNQKPTAEAVSAFMGSLALSGSSISVAG